MNRTRHTFLNILKTSFVYVSKTGKFFYAFLFLQRVHGKGGRGGGGETSWSMYVGVILISYFSYDRRRLSIRLGGREERARRRIEKGSYGL